jgi:hypothetical protein
MPTLITVDKTPPPEPQSIIYRLPVEQRAEEEIAIEEERSRRIFFLDRHNETAAKLARSMFPQLIKFKTKIEFDMYKVVVATHGKAVRKKDDVTSVTDIFRALCKKFVTVMSHFGLHLKWNKGRRKHWVEDFDQAHTVPETEHKKPKGKVQIYCQRCIDDNRLGLVGNLLLQFTGTNEQLSELDLSELEVTDELLPLFGVVVQEIYYHSALCGMKKNLNRSTYEKNGLVHLDIPTTEVLGTTYDGAVKQINNHPKVGSYFDPLLSQKTRKEIKKQCPEFNSVNLRKKPTWQSFGELINFKKLEYDYDDRSYLLLPGCEVKFTETEHIQAMARLGYHMVAQLGLEDEFSPFLLDNEAVMEMWNRGRKKIYTNKWKTNPKQHLFMREVSLLFGGIERRITGVEPVHQWLHQDGAKNYDDMPPGLTLPGSFEVPLEITGRPLCSWSPTKPINVPFRSMIMFQGNFPHFGMTRRATEEMMVAIHGHLDSSHYVRGGSILELHTAMNSYLPPEHLQLYDNGPFLEHFINEERQFRQLCGAVWERFEKIDIDDDVEGEENEANNAAVREVIEEARERIQVYDFDGKKRKHN